MHQTSPSEALSVSLGYLQCVAQLGTSDHRMMALLLSTEHDTLGFYGHYRLYGDIVPSYTTKVVDRFIIWGCLGVD